VTRPHIGNFGIALALFAIASGPALADQIVLKNGDRISGAIIKQDGKTITIKTDSLGAVSAAWDQVVSVTSDKPIYVVLPDGKTVQGALGAAGGSLEVAAASGKVSVPLADVKALRNAGEQQAYERLLSPSLLQLWTVAGSLGFAGATGNAKTLTFTTSAGASRVTRTDKILLNFNAIKASAMVGRASAATAEAVRGGVEYDRNVGARVFVNTFNSYEYDRFQALDLRVTLGGGIGAKVYNSERATLGLVAGVDYDHSRFSVPLTRNAAEFFWGDDYSLKINNASSLVQRFRMFNNLSDLGASRVNFDLTLSTKLKTWLSWNVSLSDRYLSKPVQGRKTNDFLYSTGIGVSFAR
jgi:putative salt-induced outer membrane protein YdiY